MNTTPLRNSLPLCLVHFQCSNTPVCLTHLSMDLLQVIIQLVEPVED